MLMVRELCVIWLQKNRPFAIQPFTATDDPTVLGIKPIPNIQQKISDMIEKYRKKTIDIEDVEFEEVDLELDVLFPDIKAQQSSNTIESH